MRPFLSGSGSSGQLIGRVEMLMLAIVLLWNWNWQTNLDEKHPVQKQIKQRQDSIEGFEKGGRADLVEKEKAELAVLKSYLPEELSQEQVEEVVKATIAELGATTKADMGKVMKAVQVAVAGRADNRLVSQLVSANLA